VQQQRIEITLHRATNQSQELVTANRQKTLRFSHANADAGDASAKLKRCRDLPMNLS